MARTPNTSCFACGKSFYKRPSQKEESNRHFCSALCYKLINSRKEKTCVCCGNYFFPKTSTQTTCSKVCSAKKSRKPWSTKRKGLPRNKVKDRLFLLESTFETRECMIHGCSYDRILVVHRHVQGKDGGKYEIGNMFMICPNHHSEIHSGLIEVDKENDSCLVIRKMN